MKKLEEIPKNNVFKVPEGYFDRLPGVIQARVNTPKAELQWPLWFRSVAYAFPVVLLMTVGIFWYQSSSTNLSAAEIESELGDIQPDQLASYLEDRDLSTEELTETVSWTTDDLNELEASIYSQLNVSNHELELTIDEYDEL